MQIFRPFKKLLYGFLDIYDFDELDRLIEISEGWMKEEAKAMKRRRKLSLYTLLLSLFSLAYAIVAIVLRHVHAA